MPARRGADAIIIDMHAEATSEKMAMAHFVDGRVSLIVGTHTHVPTGDDQILPGGTAYISDVGMCGDYNSVIGMEKTEPLNRFVHKVPAARLEPATGPATVCGIAVETDDATGLALKVGADPDRRLSSAGCCRTSGDAGCGRASLVLDGRELIGEHQGARPFQAGAVYVAAVKCFLARLEAVSMRCTSEVSRYISLRLAGVAGPLPSSLARRSAGGPPLQSPPERRGNADTSPKDRRSSSSPQTSSERMNGNP